MPESTVICPTCKLVRPRSSFMRCNRKMLSCLPCRQEYVRIRFLAQDTNMCITCSKQCPTEEFCRGDIVYPSCLACRQEYIRSRSTQVTN